MTAESTHPRVYYEGDAWPLDVPRDERQSVILVGHYRLEFRDQVAAILVSPIEERYIVYDLDGLELA
jgi:hypothetical protein